MPNRDGTGPYGTGPMSGRRRGNCNQRYRKDLEYPKDKSLKGKITAHIDNDKCIKCMKCVSVCPERAIEGNIREYAKVNENLCKGCGDCIKVCPVNAISLHEFIGTDRGMSEHKTNVNPEENLIEKKKMLEEKIRQLKEKINSI
ncbi:MAG: 4Fe-4S dicluster domain-containing protein [Thermoplasmata archaeon]